MRDTCIQEVVKQSKAYRVFQSKLIIAKVRWWDSVSVCLIVGKQKADKGKRRVICRMMCELTTGRGDEHNPAS